MQPQLTSSRPAHSYAQFYKDCASYPELPKFRRLAAQWTKTLYDDLDEVLKAERRLDDAIAESRTRAGAHPLTFLECPRSILKDKVVLRQWHKYKQLLRAYSQDLCLYNELFKLPIHAPYFSRRFKGYEELFHNGHFGPTDEQGAAAEYRDAESHDFVAGVGMDRSDILNNLWADNVDWIEKQIFRRVRSWLRLDQQSSDTRVDLETIIKTIDALTCLFVPLLFTATLFALALIRRLMVRIAVVGALGIAFAVSAKLIYGRISRGDIFAFTAAFFAVASVFVSTTDGSVSNIS